MLLATLSRYTSDGPNIEVTYAGIKVESLKQCVYLVLDVASFSLYNLDSYFLDICDTCSFSILVLGELRL